MFFFTSMISVYSSSTHRQRSSTAADG